MNKKEIKQFNTWFKKHFVETDLIDKEHEIDLTLTVEENQTIFKDKFGDYYIETSAEKKDKIADLKIQHKQSDFEGRVAEIKHKFGVEVNFVR